jgi:hypothetical protein
MVVDQGSPPTTRRVPVSLFSSSLRINTQAGTAYTLLAADGVQTLVQMNNASPMTLTIPSFATLALPIGTNVLVERLGAGTLTIAGAGGVTVQGPSLTARVQYSFLGLICTALNTWQVCGDYT